LRHQFRYPGIINGSTVSTSSIQLTNKHSSIKTVIMSAHHPMQGVPSITVGHCVIDSCAERITQRVRVFRSFLRMKSPRHATIIQWSHIEEKRHPRSGAVVPFSPRCERRASLKNHHHQLGSRPFNCCSTRYYWRANTATQCRQ